MKDAIDMARDFSHFVTIAYSVESFLPLNLYPKRCENPRKKCYTHVYMFLIYFSFVELLQALVNYKVSLSRAFESFCIWHVG